MSNDLAIKQRLLQFWQSRDRKELLPTLIPEAKELVHSNSFAYLLAACLDRGMVADIVWTIPYWLKQELGHLDPHLISMMSLDGIRATLLKMPKRPRYMRDAPRTIHELVAMVLERFSGDAANLWKNRTARAVQNDLMEIYCVGRGIAAMTVILICRLGWTEFPDLDTMPIKPDVHVQRVMYRMGLAENMTEQAATCAARRINPQFPGDLDSPLWVIGREFCFSIPKTPDCAACPITDLCPKIGLET